MSHAGEVNLASAGSYPHPGGMVEARALPSSSSSSSGSGDLPTPQPPTLEVSVLCWALTVWGVPVTWLIV